MAPDAIPGRAVRPRWAPGREGLGGLLLLAALSGCGGGVGSRSYPADADSRAISDLIGAWNDAKDDPKLATPLFARGSAPGVAEFKRYGRRSYSMASPPTVAGDSATVPVTVFDEAAGKDAGPVPWSLVREGGGWKLKSAPLP